MTVSLVLLEHRRQDRNSAHRRKMLALDQANLDTVTTYKIKTELTATFTAIVLVINER